MLKQFGAGQLIGRRSDIPNSAPVAFGNLQEFSLDFSFTTKELMGANQFAIDVARGAGKITGKAKVATISGLAMNSLFFGATLSAGQLGAAMSEAALVPAAAAYTVNVANAAAFVQDFGCAYVNSAIPMQKVAAAPAAGQYAVNEATGAYTFAAADANAAILISYAYNVPGSGQKIVLTNQLMGTTPTFSLLCKTSYKGQATTYFFNRAMSTKLSFGVKNDDYQTPDFDLSIYADDNGNIGTMSYSEAS